MAKQTKTATKGGLLHRSKMYGFELFMALFGLVTTAVVVDYGLFALFNYLRGLGNSGGSEAIGEFSVWIVAAMIVWLPVTLFFYLRSRGEMAAQPKHADSKLHKVLVTLYLIGTILTVIGFAFAAVYSLLRLALSADVDASEVLVRVTLPAVLALCLHLWLTQAYVTNRIGRTVFAAVFGGFAGIMVISLLVVSILTVRGASHDRQVSSDLQAVSTAVRDYSRNNSKLPEALADVTIVDNKVKERVGNYTYKKVNANDYELCADFMTDTMENAVQYESRNYYSASFRYHEKGNHCFKQRVYSLPVSTLPSTR